MKAIKILFAIVILLALALGGVAYYVWNNLDRLVEELIETEGSAALQTQLAVGSVKIELLDGKGAINALSLANPEGFSRNSLFKFDQAVLQIDPQSLTDKVKVIKQISLNGVAFRAEHKGLKELNITALLDNIKQGSSGTSNSSQQNASGGDDVRLMVERLQFGASDIVLESEQFGSRTITLPAYAQSNIGSKQSGLTPEQLAEAIAKNMLRTVEKAVKRELREAAKDKAEEKVKEKAEEKLKEKLGDKISEEDVDKLKGLFK